MKTILIPGPGVLVTDTLGTSPVPCSWEKAPDVNQETVPHLTLAFPVSYAIRSKFLLFTSPDILTKIRFCLGVMRTL